MTEPLRDARELLALLAERDWSIATAESLTGGLVASALIDVPGASVSMRGGVIAYDTDLKCQLLGVDAELLRTRGPVDADVARQMASGVRRALALDGRPAGVGLATTGVAGPGPADGQPAGTVFVAVATPLGVRTAHEVLDGDRARIRRACVALVLRLAIDAVRE